MGKRRRIVVIATFAVILATALWIVLRPKEKEPVFEGKRLSTWLTNYLVQPARPVKFLVQFTPPAWEESDRAVRAMGTNAIPTLLRMLESRDSALKLKLVSLAQKQRLISFNHLSAIQKQQMATKALNALRTDAAPAVPALIKIYERHPDVEARIQAANILTDVGPTARQAIPSFVRVLADPNPAGTNSRTLQMTTIRAIGQIGGDTAIIVPALIKCLTNTNVCGPAIVALGSLHAEPALTVPALIKTLSNPKPAYSQEWLSSISSLEQFGVDAKPAIPALFNFLETQTDKDNHLYIPAPTIRAMYVRATVNAIRKIDPETAQESWSELNDAMQSLRNRTP